MTSHDFSLPTIHQARSLRSSVTDALRTAIIVGDLEEGQLYSAPALAAELGVSATPVREAMMDLAGEGLVTTVKNKGFRVTTMTSEDLEQQTQVRQLLEGPAMRAVAGQIPEEDFARLTELADDIAVAARASDLRGYLMGDLELHALLVSYTGNAQLVQLTKKLRGQTRLKALRNLAASGQLIHSAHEHHQLLELLRTGDREAACSLTIRHIGHASRLWSTGSEQDGADGGSEGSPLLDLLAPSERVQP